MNVILQILVLAAGFVLLVKGSDYFVDGSAGLAARFGIPQLVIGLTVVAMDQCTGSRSEYYGSLPR